MKIKTYCAADIWNDVPIDDVEDQGYQECWVHKNTVWQLVKQLEWYARNDETDDRMEKLVNSVKKDLESETK